MFSGLKQKLGQGLADTATRSLNLVNQARQDGSARSPATPGSNRRPSTSSQLSETPTGSLVDLSLPSPDSHGGSARQSGGAVASRSRTSSISSQTSDASFMTPSSSSVMGQSPYPCDDRASVSEAETDDQSAIVASMTKEELYQLYSRCQRRGQQYKWKYMQNVAAYKELEEERDKLKSTLTQTQDKALRRISELKEQAQLDQQAKKDLENNYQLMLEEKDEALKVLRMQINLLKEGKDIPAELASKLDSVSGEKSQAVPLANSPASATEEAALREKVKRLEGLLTKCKETIQANKERSLQMSAERESMQKELDLKSQEFEAYRAEHDETVAKYQSQIKQARQVIEELEADKSLALASFKQDFHSTLEVKDEELSKVRAKAKLLEAENETLKQNLSELQISTQEQLDKEREQIRQLTEEKRALEEDAKLKLEISEQRMEQIRANELQELRRGKVEALQVLQKQMDDRIAALHGEKEAALAELDKQWEEKWKQREAAKEAALRARMADQQAEMELAVEDQQLQKSAAVRQQESAILQLQQRCNELAEENRNVTQQLDSVRQELADRTREYVNQIEDNVTRNKEQVIELTAQHAKAMDECKAQHDRLIEQLQAEYSVKISQMESAHEDRLRQTSTDLESTYQRELSDLKAEHSAAVEGYRSKVAQLQQEVTDLCLQMTSQSDRSVEDVAAADVEWKSKEKQWQTREDELRAQLAAASDTNVRLQGQIQEVAERENRLNVELEVTKVDREREIAVQNEAMQRLRAEIDTLTASETQMRIQLNETSVRYNERMEQFERDSAESIGKLTELLQSNQSDLMSIIGELDAAQRQVAENVVKLDEQSAELDACRNELSTARDDLAAATGNEARLRASLSEAEALCSSLQDKVALYERQLIDNTGSSEELLQRISELESKLVEKDRSISEFETRIRDFGEQIGRETASVHERSRQVETLLVENERLMKEKDAELREQTESSARLQQTIERLEAEIDELKSSAACMRELDSGNSGDSRRVSDEMQSAGDASSSSAVGVFSDEDRTKLEAEIKALRENLDQAHADMKCFKDGVRKQFEERKQKVRVTIERMKAGFEESLRERDEQHKKDLANLVEEKDREKENAISHLKESVDSLTADRDLAVSEALARQSGEVDFLKAELASIKVRLRDALSQNQAEKDAFLKQAESERVDIFRRLDEIQRESSVHGVENNAVAFSEDGCESPALISAASDVVDVAVVAESSVLQEESAPELNADSTQRADNGRIEPLELEVKELREKYEAKVAEYEHCERALKSLEQEMVDVQKTYEGRISELSAKLEDREKALVDRDAEWTKEKSVGESQREEMRKVFEEKQKSHSDAEQTKTALQIELSAVKDELAAKCAALKESEEKLAAAVDRTRFLDAECSDRATQLAACVDEMSAVKVKASAELSALVAKHEDEIASLKKRLDELNQSLERKTRSVEELENTVKNAESKLATESELLNAKISELLREVDGLESEKVSLSEQCERKSAELAVIAGRTAELEAEVSQLNASLLAANTDLKDCKGQLVTRENEAVAARELLVQLEGKHETQVTEERRTMRNLIDGKDAEIAEKSQQIEALNKTLDELKQCAGDEKAGILSALQLKEGELESLKKQHSEELDVRSRELAEKSQQIEALNKTLDELKQCAGDEKAGILSALQLKEGELESLKKLHSEELDVRSRELAEKSQQIEALNKTLDELKQCAGDEKAGILSALQLKEGELESLKKQHSDKLDDITQNFLKQISELKAEHAALTDTGDGRLKDLESQIVELKAQLESTSKKAQDLDEELSRTDSLAKSMQHQLAANETELCETRNQVAHEIETKSAEIASLNKSVTERTQRLACLQTLLQQWHKTVGLDADLSFFVRPQDGVSDADVWDFSEFTNCLERLVNENKSLQQSIGEVVICADQTDSTVSLSASRPPPSDPAQSSGQTTTSPVGTANKTAIQASDSDEELMECSTKSNASEEQHKAHVQQLNAIIEDLQQRLLDQEMETDSYKEAARRAEQNESRHSLRSTEGPGDLDSSGLTVDQLRSQVSDLKHQLEQATWLHSLEVNQLYGPAGSNGGTPVAAGSRNGLDQSDDVNRLMAEINRLKRNERALINEVESLKAESHNGANNSVYTIFGPLLTEPTEIEYLRNILYQYMLGTETKTLSKVICQVMKFSDEQTKHIIERERKKEWLSPRQN